MRNLTHVCRDRVAISSLDEYEASMYNALSKLSNRNTSYKK